MSIINKFSLKIQTWKFQLKTYWSQRKTRQFRMHDEHLVQRLTTKRRWPSLRQLKYLSEYLSGTERLILRVATGVMIVGFACLFLNLYWTHSTSVPKSGGTYTEGLVGSPRFINPLFASANDVDLDLTSLVFSGLLKYSNTGMAKDLATDYQISSDQKTYTFQLRQNATFHDGTKLTADDVLFTFNLIKDPKTKSPLSYNFTDVNVEKVNDYSIKFTLKNPFAPFLESLTVGILPQHIWKNIQPENLLLAEYNLKPIGSGPYEFKSLVKDKSGEILTYTLQKNTKYYLGAPYINELAFKFLTDFNAAVDALNNKNVEGISYLPKELRERVINNRNLNFHLLQMPQYTAVFFNYANNVVLQDVAIRKLLTHATDKEKIVNEILNAEAQILNGCVLPNMLGYCTDTALYPYNVDYARTQLDKAGWKLADYKPANADSDDANYPYPVRKSGKKYLEFTLTTVNQPENVKIAEELQKEWQQINVKVNLKIVNPSDIQEVIKNRDYDALLYSQILGDDPDPYPFWDSSQRAYPGLNLTSLNDPTIDKLLESARQTTDANARAKLYQQFQKRMADLVPAIFLYSPTYTYPQAKKIKGFDASKILTPSNRFDQVNEWYVNTNRKWTD